MRKIVSFLLVVMVVTQPACFPKKEKLTKVWFYTYSNNPGGDDDLNINPASFLNLQADGFYTRDFGIFDFGHWEKNGKELKLINGQNKTFVFPVKLLGNELELLTPKGNIVNFEGKPASFASPGANPFSVDNNQWRIAAKRKETEQEIKKRLINHCRFYEIYFRWALDNELSSIDVRSTPSLIKIYGNGFELKPFDELPEAWRFYFFDQEDCRKASEMIKDVFNHSDIAWSNSDNKFKMFISAFQQLQQLLKEK
ncbi:MAG: hypothetical protein WDN26_13110 [Chitinophagaceae bacterium]